MANGSYQATIPAPVEPIQPAAVFNPSEKQRFSHVRIHYWQNAIYQGFCRNLGCIILRSLLHKAGAIFCQTLQWTMNNISQNTASGSFRGSPLRNDRFAAGGRRAANFRRCGIRGQKRPRGRFSSNHFSPVMIDYLKNANYQGFRPDWPVKLCSFFELGRRNFLPGCCLMKIIGQSLFERRRKSGEPLPKSGNEVCGFRGFGIAANFLQSLQEQSAASCQSPGNGENNFSLTRDAENQNAFRVRRIPMPVCLRAGFQFGGRIDDRTGKDTLFHFGTEPFENQLKSVLCLVP